MPLVHKGELMVSYKVIKVKCFEAKPLILFATFIAEDRGLLKFKNYCRNEYAVLCLDIFNVHCTHWPVFLVDIDPGYLSLLGTQLPRGREGFFTRFLQGGSILRSSTLLFCIPYWQERYPFHLLSLNKGTPFTCIPS